MRQILASHGHDNFMTTKDQTNNGRPLDEADAEPRNTNPKAILDAPLTNRAFLLGISYLSPKRSSSRLTMTSMVNCPWKLARENSRSLQDTLIAEISRAGSERAYE